MANIVGGEPTADWPAVVALYAYSNTQGSDAFCSGTLIAPDAVLTAAHCVDRLREHTDGGSNVYVVFGTDVRGGSDGFAQVVDAVQHPDWVPGSEHDEEAGSDVAVLKLDAAVDVAPMPLNEAPVDDAWLGLELDVVGWGRTAEEAGDAGTKRHVAVPVTGYADWYVQLGEAGSGRNACYGDSGGAVLRTFDDGVTRLVGVSTLLWWHAGAEDACVDGWGWHLRVDARRDFVDEALATLAAPAEDTGHTGETGAAPGPGEEAPACGCAATGAARLVSIGALVAALARRR